MCDCGWVGVVSLLAERRERREDCLEMRAQSLMGGFNVADVGEDGADGDTIASRCGRTEGRRLPIIVGKIVDTAFSTARSKSAASAAVEDGGLEPDVVGLAFLAGKSVVCA